MATIRLLLLSFCITYLPCASADTVRHNILESDSSTALQTQRVCSSFTRVDERFVCLPGNKENIESSGIEIDGILKANEKGYSIVNSFLEKDVTREFLDKVFREESFQSASGIFRLKAQFKEHSLDYTPHHFMGAFKLANPSLPEIQIAGVKESTVRYAVTSLTPELGEVGHFTWHASLAYFDRKAVFASVDLLSSTLDSLDSVIKPQKKSGIFGDGGFSFVPRSRWLPQTGLMVTRVGFGRDCPSCEERFLDLEDHLFTKTYTRAGYDIDVAYGRMYVGLVVPFDRVFERNDPLATALSHSYEIGRFRSYLSYSPMMSSFGFSFRSVLYMIGIQYTDEKQADSILLKREKHAYIHGSYFF